MPSNYRNRPTVQSRRTTAAGVPSLGDVARVADVSHQTVSRVVNGAPNVRPATQVRVEAAIEQLGYRPNLAARALVTRRTRTIGVVAVRLDQFGPNEVNHHVQVAARAAGYFVASTSLTPITQEGVADALDDLIRRGVEGVVVVAAERLVLDLIKAREGRVPTVLVGGAGSQSIPAVDLDQRAGARLATRHLLELGHQVVAHVSGPSGWADAEAREDGWRQALADAGLVPGPLLRGDWSAAGGYDLGCRIARDHAVTAVFAANDQTAVGVLRAMHDAGRTVPDDVSVVGFDDLDEAAYLLPPLTTVHQDLAALGQRALDVLDAAIRRSDQTWSRLLVPTVVVRGSTAAPASREIESQILKISKPKEKDDAAA